jgi:hypothetical protein
MNNLIVCQIACCKWKAASHRCLHFSFFLFQIFQISINGISNEELTTMFHGHCTLHILSRVPVVNEDDHIALDFVCAFQCPQSKQRTIDKCNDRNDNQHNQWQFHRGKQSTFVTVEMTFITCFFFSMKSIANYFFKDKPLNNKSMNNPQSLSIPMGDMLPNEITHLVLSMLSIQDLLRAAQVCRLWYTFSLSLRRNRFFPVNSKFCANVPSARLCHAGSVLGDKLIIHGGGIDYNIKRVLTTMTRVSLLNGTTDIDF